MWAYESVFYQIYPLGFCGAPFENDGVPKLMTGFLISRKLGRTLFTFRLYLNLIHMGIIREIIQR